MRTVILDSSFNPPTKAHVWMMRHLLSQDKANSPLFVLSTSNVDKPSTDISNRVTLINTLNIPLKVINCPKFVEKAKMFPNTETVFILGYDTLVRFFDPKYYDDFEREIDLFFSLSRIALYDRLVKESNTDKEETLEERSESLWKRSELRQGRKWRSKVDLMARLPSSIESLSSSSVRKEVAEYYKTGLNYPKLQSMVEDSVLKLIIEKNMYRCD